MVGAGTCLDGRVTSAAGVYGTYSDENVHGTSENDFISPGAGADGVYGYEGDDFVCAADTFYPGYTA